MKRITLFLISIIVLSVLVFTGCAKEEGCTDPDSINYSATAEVDDGSCEYEGSVVFWYDEATAVWLVDDWATALYFYVDNQLVGTQAASVYWISSPSCGANGSVTCTKYLGSYKTQSYTYRVIDQSGWEYWSGILNFNANSCSKVRLIGGKKK